MFGSTRDTFIQLLTTQKPMEIWWNNRGRVAAVVDHSDVRITLSKDMLSGLHGDKSLRFCFQTDSTVEEEVMREQEGRSRGGPGTSAEAVTKGDCEFIEFPVTRGPTKEVGDGEGVLGLWSLEGAVADDESSRRGEGIAKATCEGSLSSVSSSAAVVASTVRPTMTGTMALQDRELQEDVDGGGTPGSRIASASRSTTVGHRTTEILNLNGN